MNIIILILIVVIFIILSLTIQQLNCLIKSFGPEGLGSRDSQKVGYSKSKAPYQDVHSVKTRDEILVLNQDTLLKNKDMLFSSTGSTTVSKVDFQNHQTFVSITDSQSASDKIKDFIDIEKIKTSQNTKFTQTFGPLYKHSISGRNPVCYKINHQDQFYFDNQMY